MKRLLLLTSVILYSAFALAANNFPVKGIPKKTVEAYCPSFITIPMNTIQEAKFIAEGYGQNHAGGYWDTYSDRSKNTTFTTSSCKEPYKTLGFKEKVRIAKIKNGTALVYSIPESDMNFPEIPPQELCMGWIPMDNLIIPRYALNSPLGNEIKILLNGRNKQDVENIFFSMPDGNSEVISNEYPNSFFYLIKKNDGNCLISASRSIDFDSIIGWIDESSIIEWKGRLAIEPTWEPVNIRYFKEKSIECDINSAIGTGTHIGSIPYSLTAVNSYEEYNYHMRANEWRFPVITVKANSINCAIPSTSHFLYDSMESIARDVVPQNYSEVAGGVNIVFIIDGSRAMEPCFPIISEKLGKIPAIIGKPTKIGVVIYHDSRNSEHMLESFPLADPGNMELFNFIDYGGNYGFKDNLSNAPICAAIRYSIDSFDLNYNDSNYIIVIGGNGDNSDTEDTPGTLAQDLKDRNISLFGIQVKSDPHSSSYRSFNYILEDIILHLKGGDAKDSVNMRKTDGEYGIVSYIFSSDRGEAFEKQISVESGLMDEDVFKFFLDGIIERIGTYAFNPDGLQLNRIDIFSLANCNKKYEGKDFFDESILYTKDQLEQTMNTYRTFSSLDPSSKACRAQLTGLLTKYLSSNKTLECPAKEYSAMGYMEALLLREGVSIDDDTFKGEAIKDIISEKVVSDNRLKNIIDNFKRTCNLLEKVYLTPSTYSSIINGEKYYWVPLDYFK